MRKYSIEETKRRLDAIGRLRLVTNTYEELSALTDRKVDGKNGLSKIGGTSTFIKEAAYDALCAYMTELTGIDFDQLLTDYQEASDYYERHRAELRGQEDCLRRLLDRAYGADAPSGSACPVNVPLLLLLALGLYPPYQSGRGNVGDVEGQFRRLIRFLKDYVQDNTIYEHLPAISSWERLLLTDGEHTATRLNLYVMTNEVLSSYQTMKNRDLLYYRNVELRSRTVELADEDITYWQRYEGDELWELERISNGYFLRRYVLDGQRRQAMVEQYELFAYQVDGTVLAQCVHPRSILHIVENEPIPRDEVEEFECTMDDEQHPTELTFHSITSFHWLRLDTLQRLPQAQAEVQRRLEGYDVRNRFPETEYSYQPGLAAITPSSIYVPTGQGRRCYRVPKTLHEHLQLVELGDTAGLAVFSQSGQRYICFSDLQLHYPVSTAQECKQLGIVVTELCTD